MRSLKAPPRYAELATTPDANAGSALFNQVGCNVCHTRSMTTAEPETPINGGAMLVSRALGNKRIQPFGDFLLHDIGTGDGIVQNGGAVLAQQGAHRATVGTACPHPVHARLPQPQHRRRHSAAQQPGGGHAARVQRAEPDRPAQADDVPAFALGIGNQESGIRNQR